MTEKLNHTLFALARVPVKVHFSYYVFVITLLAGSFMFSSSEKFELVFQVLVGTFSAVLCHELGHAFVAHRLRHKVHDIMIFPVGGIATIYLDKRRHSDIVKIAAAGPLVNLAIAAFLFLIPISTCQIAGYINLFLGVGNLLPVKSFDGGHILHAIVTQSRGKKRADSVLQTVTLATVGLICLCGLYFSSWTILLSGLFIFVYGAVNDEEESTG